MGQQRGANPGRTNAPAQGTPAQAANMPRRGHTPAARQKPPPHMPTAAEIAADKAANLLYTWNKKKFDRQKLDLWLSTFKTPTANSGHDLVRRNKASRDGILQNIKLLINFIENDPMITDIRWMAYMMATACWETGGSIQQPFPVLDPKTNAQKIDSKTHRPLFISENVWKTVQSSFEESGQGEIINFARDKKNNKIIDLKTGQAIKLYRYTQYYRPAKIYQLPKGEVRVTEYDGDQFIIDQKGNYRDNPTHSNPHPHYGAKYSQAISDVYINDPGTELKFYGRGYVQLTWWFNYATAGYGIGQGLKLLLNPQLALVPQISYAVMSYGMRTGRSYATHKKLSDYFHGAHTDYYHARQIINRNDEARTFRQCETWAKQFEKMFLMSITP